MLGKRCLGSDVFQGQAVIAWASVEGRRNFAYWCSIFISTGRYGRFGQV